MGVSIYTNKCKLTPFLFISLFTSLFTFMEKTLKRLIAKHLKDRYSKIMKPLIINPANRRFLKGLTTQEKVCFFCVAVCGMTENEIAGFLNISPHTVKCCIIRAKEKIKESCGL